MLWCLKYIYIWLTPFGPLYGGPGDPQVPKMAKPGTLYLYQIRWKSLRILCLLMPKSQNFRAILCNWENWEIFANFESTNLLDFRIPGKILSEIFVQLIFWCLVTLVTPQGGHFRSINNHIMSHQNFTQNFTRNPKIKFNFFKIEKLQKILSLFKNEEDGIAKFFFKNFKNNLQ